MINTYDILETIRMIQDECLDIRTTTMGISLLDCGDSDIDKSCQKVYDKICKKAENLVKTGEAIEKEYGKGSIMKLGDRVNVSVDVIPSGSLALDQARGIGGYPKGRIIEIYGPESSGKTTLALHAIAECQKAGGRCAFIDAENAIDPVYAKNLGVDIDELILSQPDSGEQALDIC